MKKNRQEAIIELIQQYPIETQEELLSRLNQIGFKTTQATISRDQETGCRWEADLLSDRSGR